MQITDKPYIGPVINRRYPAEQFRYVRLQKGLSFGHNGFQADCKLIGVNNRTVDLELTYSGLSEVNIAREADSAKTTPAFEIIEHDEDAKKITVRVAANAYFKIPELGVFRFEKKGPNLVVFHVNKEEGTTISAF